MPGWQPGDTTIITEPGEEEEDSEESEFDEKEADSLLDPETASKLAQDAPTPSETGDDAAACYAATRALNAFNESDLSEAELSSQFANAKALAASSTMRQAIERALDGGSIPACPPEP